MANILHQIHILRSPENDVVFAHAHDAASHAFVDTLLQSGWPGKPWTPTAWEGQAVFPLDSADHLVNMAKFEGIDVVDGPHCL